jgi:hypothetical protein
MDIIVSMSTPQLLGVSFGTLSIIYGLRALTSPFEFAKAFGYPQRTGEPINPFVFATGGRTVALGLAIVALSSQDNIQASGTIIACCVPSAICDSYSCYKHGNPAFATQHCIGTVVLGILGYYLHSTSS